MPDAKRIKEMLHRATERGRLQGLEEAARIAEADLAGGPDLVPAEKRFDGGASEKTARRIALAIRRRALGPLFRGQPE